jgi:hypothetical protein
MLLEHGILTTPQLVALGFASLRMTQSRLHALHALRLTDRVQPFTTRGRLPLHHLLGPVGARVIAAEEHLTVTQLGWRHDRALAAAFSHTLAHNRATADLVCAIAATAGITLTRWWSATRCARYFGHHTRPDAYLTLTATPIPPQPRPPQTGPPLPGRVARDPRAGSALPAGWWEAFLEYDTGTENLAVLAAKIHGYHRLALATGITTPVLIYTARSGREPSARAALAHTLHALPHPALVPIATATTPPGTTTSTDPSTDPSLGAGVGADAGGVPGGRVWLPLTPGPRPENTQLPRLRLAELATMPLPHPSVGPRQGTLLDPRRRPVTTHPHTTPTSPHSNGFSPDGLPDYRPHDPSLHAAHHTPGEPPADGIDELDGMDGMHDKGGFGDAAGVVDLPAPPPIPPAPAAARSAARTGRPR